MSSATLPSFRSSQITRTTTIFLSSPSSSSLSKRSLKIPKLSIHDQPSSSLPDNKVVSTFAAIKSDEIDAKIKRTRKDLSFKSLFGRRSLWRRIFFASKKVRSIILLNVITLVYASNIPVLKEVESIMDPALFNVVRFAVSTVPFLPSVFQARNDIHIVRAGTELGLWVSLGYLLQALGLLTSEAGRASFISMLTVIVVPLLDGLLGASVPTLTWFGAVMSVLGVALLESSGSPPTVGDFFNFLSAVFFGIHMLRTERISRTTRRENFVALLGYEVCIVALLSTMWYSLGGWFTGLDPQPWTWDRFWGFIVLFPWIPAIYTGIFSTGIFSTGLCLWIEMAAMQDVSATETAIIYGLEPVWGASFAWYLLGERWGTTGWLGVILVLGGSLTVQLFGSQPTTDQSDDKNGQACNGKIGPSASPVTVKSEKDRSSTFRK